MASLKKSVICTFVALLNTFLLSAGIEFGSPASALNLGSGTRLKILAPSLTVTQGTIKKGTGSSIAGSNITFRNGFFAADTSQALLQGTVSNAGLFGIILSGNDSILNAEPGRLIDRVSVRNNFNRIEGQPIFTQSDAITLQDAATTLTIAIHSVLNQNLVLNGGTLVLESDLALGNNAILSTNGKVRLNGRRLALSGQGSQWGGSILWDHARDIVMNGKVVLSGLWTFTGVSNLNGNGNVLDLTLGGSLWIRTNSVLSLTDVELRGLGTGRIVFEDQSSQLRISNVEIEMNRTFSVTTGGIYAEGPTNIVTGTNLLIFEQKGSLTVDGIGLTYDTLRFIEKFNVRPTFTNDFQHRFISYPHDGIIYRKSNLDLIRFNSNALIFNARNNSGTLKFLARNNSAALLFCCRNNSNTLKFLARNNSNTLLYLHRTESNAMLFLTKNNSNGIVWLDIQLQTIDHGPLDIIVNTSYFKMRFDVYLSGVHKMYVNVDTTIDGDGHIINFTNKQSNMLVIGNGLKVEFKDVTFRNYFDEAIFLGAGSSMVFGNCTRLELFEKRQMQRTWFFDGETMVRGFGNKLVIDPFGSIDASPHTMLTLQDIVLDGVQDSNIALKGALSSLTLRDAHVCLSNNFNFTSGVLKFEDDVRITGSAHFFFRSQDPATILPCSTLLLDNVGFKYAPPVANRNLLVMSDETSQLALDGCALHSTTTGMRLKVGTLIVDHYNTLANDGAVAVSEGFAFGNGSGADDLTIHMRPASSLNLISGVLDYQNVD